MSAPAQPGAIIMMDIVSPKIAQLIAEARIELKRLGIDIDGKRSDELLNMVREQRTARQQPRGKADRNAGGHCPASAARYEKASQ
jgi:hypothetical protein